MSNSNLLVFGALGYGLYALMSNDDERPSDLDRPEYRRVIRTIEDPGPMTHVPRWYSAAVTDAAVDNKPDGVGRITNEEFVSRHYTGLIPERYREECNS